jgi:hypothetical protein
MWGGLSDERTCLPCTISAGPRQGSTAGLLIIFYCLRFETPPTWRTRSPYLNPPGTGWPSYTTRHWVLKFRVRVRVYRQSLRLGAEPTETHGQFFFSQMNTCGHSPHITSSLSRGYVCHSQLLLALASEFILGSQSRGTRDHFLLSQILRDFLSVASYDSQGYGGGIRPRLHTGTTKY